MIDPTDFAPGPIPNGRTISELRQNGVLDWTYLHEPTRIYVFVAKRGGRGDDWACYLSSGSANESEVALIDHAITFGAKLPERWACAVFPDVELEYRP